MRNHVAVPLVRKFLSVAVCLTFLAPNSAPLYAKSVQPPSTSTDGQSDSFRSEQSPGALNLIIPSSLGFLDDTAAGKLNKCVILIRDAHAQYGIQTNISQIIKRVAESCPISFVGVEGAQGYVDLGGYRSLPNAKARDAAATSLLKEARIGGPEYFGICQKSQIPLFGAEDIAIHRQNIQMYKEAISSNAPLMKILDRVQAAFQQAKSQIFPAKLLELDGLVSGFESGKIDFGTFSKKIRQIAAREGVSLNGYPVFNKTAQSLEMEKQIDFESIGKITQELVKDMGARSSVAQGRDLVKLTLQYRVGRLNALDYYRTLLGLADKMFQGKIPDRFASLKQYQKFLEFTQGAGQADVFDELKDLEAHLKDRMVSDVPWRVLDGSTQSLTLLKNLLSLQLSAEQWEAVNEKGVRSHVDALGDFFREHWDKISLPAASAAAVKELTETDAQQWQEALNRAKRFYEIVGQRNALLAENTLREMDRQNAKYAVLVTGGFHTAAIKDYLAAKDVSCVVITPSATGIEAPNRYQAIMMGWRYPLERILEMLWNGDLKGAPSHRLGAGQAYAPRKMGTLKAAAIFMELETSKPEFYGLFRMFYTALQDGEMPVLETTDYKIFKKDDPKNKDNRQFFYVDKVKGFSYLLGTVTVTREKGEAVAIDMDSFELDPAFKVLGEDKKTAFVRKLGDIARLGVQEIKEKAPEGWKDSKDMLVSSVHTVANAMDPNQRAMWLNRTVLSAAKALAPSAGSEDPMDGVKRVMDEGNLKMSQNELSQTFERLIQKEFGEPFTKHQYINQDRDQTQRQTISQFIEEIKKKNESGEAISEKEMAILYGFWNRYFNTDMAYQHIVEEDFNQVNAEWLMNDIAMNEKHPGSIRSAAQNYYFLMSGDKPSIRWGTQPGDPAMPYAQMQRGVHNVLVRQDPVGFGFSEWMLGHRYAMAFLEDEKNWADFEPEVKRILMKVRDTLRRSNAEEDRFGTFRLVTFRPDKGSEMEKMLTTETGGQVPLFLVFRTDEGRQVVLQRNIRGFPKEQLAYLETLYGFVTANRTWDATYDRFYTETIRPGGDMDTWEHSSRLRSETLVRDQQKWMKAGRIVTASRPKPCASCLKCVVECNEFAASVAIDMTTGKLKTGGTVQSEASTCTNCELCTARCPFDVLAPKEEIPKVIEQERTWNARIYGSPHADYLSGNLARDYIDILEHQIGRGEALGKRMELATDEHGGVLPVFVPKDYAAQPEWRKGLFVKKIYEGPSIATGANNLKFIMQKYQFPLADEELFAVSAGADPNAPLFDIVQYEVALNPAMAVLPYEKPMLVTVIRRHGETDPNKVMVIRRMKAEAVQVISSTDGKIELDMAAGAQLMGTKVSAVVHPDLPVAKNNPAVLRFEQLGLLEKEKSLQEKVEKDGADFVLTRYAMEIPPEVSDALQRRASDRTHLINPTLPVIMMPSQDPMKKEFRDLMAEVWMKYPDLREGLFKLLRAWREDMTRFSSHIHWQLRPATVAPAGTACAGCPEFQVMAAGVYIATLQALARGEVPDITYTIETGCMSETNLKAEDASHGGGIAPRVKGGRTLFGAGFAFAEAVAQVKEMAIHYGFEKKGRKYVVSQGGDGGSYIGLPEWINALRSRAYQIVGEHRNVVHWIQITDTQGYSNTGGESSLSVPIGMAGKTTPFGALLYGMQHVQTNLINWAGEFPGILVGIGHSANPNGIYEFYLKADRLGRSAMRWDWTPCEENMFLPNGADSNDWARIWAMAGLSPEVEFVGRFRKRVSPVNPHDMGKDPKTWRSRPDDMKELLYMMDSDPRFNSYMRRSARLVDVETRRQELARFLKDGIEKDFEKYAQFKPFLMEDGSLVADPEKQDKLAAMLASKINLEKLTHGPKQWDRYKPYIHQETSVVADPTAQAQLTQLVRYRDYMNWWIDAESAIAWRAEELADNYLKDMKAHYEKFKNTPERYKYSHMFDAKTGELKSEYGAELRQELIEMIIGGDFITEFELMQKSLETQVKKPIEEFEGTLDKQKKLLLARQEMSDQLYALLGEGERGEIDRILKIEEDGKKMAEYKSYLEKLSGASDKIEVRALITQIFENIKERDELLKVMDAQSEAAHKAMEGMLTEEKRLREVFERMRPFAKLQQVEEARGHVTLEDARNSFLESTMDRLLADRANARLGAVSHWTKEGMLKEAFQKKGGLVNEKSYLQSSPAGAEFRAKLARLGGRLVHRVVSISGDRGITINRLLYNVGLQYGAWAEQMPLFKSSKRGEITTSGAVLSADKVEGKDWLKSLPSHIRSIPSYEGVKNVIDVFVEDQDPKGVLIVNSTQTPEEVRNYLIGLFDADKRLVMERVQKAAFDINNIEHQQILQRVSQKIFSKNYSALEAEDLSMAKKEAEFEMYDQLVAQEMFQKDRESLTPLEFRQIRRLVAAAKVHIITVDFDKIRDDVELGVNASNLIFMSQLYHALEYMGLPVDFQRDCGAQAGTSGSGVQKTERALLETDRFSEAMASSRIGQIFKGIVKTPDRVRKYLTATRKAYAQTAQAAPPAGAYPFEKKYDAKDKEKFEKSPGGYVQVPTGGDAAGWVISQMADEDQPVVYFGYPITPSGGPFAALAKLKAEGHPYIWAVDENVPMEKVNFEKLLGASKMGYVLVTNATASQGYIHGSEVIPYAVGNRLPWIIVVCSRAKSAPWLNIEGSQEDFMTFDKDGGIILMPKNIQEHIFALYLARLIAPIVRLPVQVYLGGITDTHRQTIAKIPTDREVRAFFQKIFEKYDFLRQSLVNKQGETLFTGASAPAATYLESRAMTELAHEAARSILPDLIAETEKLTGYSFDPAEVYPHYKSPHYWQGQDIKAGSGPPSCKARTAVVMMGTHVPTAEIVLDELAAEGFTDIAMVQPRFHNPTPDEEMAQALTSLDAKTVLVMDMAGDPTRVSPTAQRVEGIHSRLLKGKPLQIRDFRYAEGGRDIPNAELRRHILDTHLLITEPTQEELAILKDLLPRDEELISIQATLEVEHKTADGEAMITRWLEEKAKADKDPYVSQMRRQIVSHLTERVAQKQRVHDWNLFAPESIRPHDKASREAERAKIRNKLVDLLLRKDYVNFLPFYGRVEFAELKEFHNISQINRETVQKIEILLARLKLNALLSQPQQIFSDSSATDNFIRQAIVLLEYSVNPENHKIAAQVLEKIIAGADANAAWKAYRLVTGSKKYWKEAVAALGHELDAPKSEMPQTEDFMGGVRVKPSREVHVDVPPPIQVQKSDTELKMLLEKISEIVNESREFPMNPVEIELEAMDRCSKIPESQLHGKKIYSQEDRRYREAYRLVYRKEVNVEVTRGLFCRDIAPELKTMFDGEGRKAISRIMHGALTAHLLASSIDLSQAVDDKQAQALVDPVDSHVLAYLKDVVYPELKSNPHIVTKDFSFYENYYNMVMKGELAQEIKQVVAEAQKAAQALKGDGKSHAFYDMAKRGEVQEFRKRLFGLVQRAGWQADPATREDYFRANLPAALTKPAHAGFEGLFPVLSKALDSGRTDASGLESTLTEWLGSEGVRQGVVEQAQRKRDAILADSRTNAQRDSFHHLRTYYSLNDAPAEAAAQADPVHNPLTERIAKSLDEARNRYREYRALRQRLQAGEKINNQEELKLYLSGRLEEMRHGITRNNNILENEILSGVKIFQTQQVDMQPWMRFFVDGADLVYASSLDAEKQGVRFSEISQALVNKGQKIDHPRDLQIFVRQSLMNNRGPREIVEHLEGRVANEVLGSMDLSQYVQLIMRQEEVAREFAWDEVTGGYDAKGQPNKVIADPLSLRLFVRKGLAAGESVDHIVQRLEGKVYGTLLRKGETQRQIKDVVEDLAKEEEKTPYPVAAPGIYERLKATKEFKTFEDVIVWVTERSKYKASSGTFPDADGLMKEAIAMGFNVGADKRGRLIPLKLLVSYNRAAPNARLVFDRIDATSVTGDIEKDLSSDETLMDGIVRTELEQLRNEAGLYFAKEGETPRKGAGEQIARYMVARAIASNREENLKSPGISDAIVKQVMALGKKVPLLLTRRAGESRGYEEYGFFTEDEYRSFVEMEVQRYLDAVNRVLDRKQLSNLSDLKLFVRYLVFRDLRESPSAGAEGGGLYEFTSHDTGGGAFTDVAGRDVLDEGFIRGEIAKEKLDTRPVSHRARILEFGDYVKSGLDSESLAMEIGQHLGAGLSTNSAMDTWQDMLDAYVRTVYLRATAESRDSAEAKTDIPKTGVDEERLDLLIHNLQPDLGRMTRTANQAVADSMDQLFQSERIFSGPNVKMRVASHEDLRALVKFFVGQFMRGQSLEKITRTLTLAEVMTYVEEKLEAFQIDPGLLWQQNLGQTILTTLIPTEARDVRELQAVADEILPVLAQQNCYLCGKPTCRSYSDALVRGYDPNANICVPGGADTMEKVFAILKKHNLLSDKPAGQSPYALNRQEEKRVAQYMLEPDRVASLYVQEEVEKALPTSSGGENANAHRATFAALNDALRQENLSDVSNDWFRRYVAFIKDHILAAPTPAEFGPMLEAILGKEWAQGLSRDEKKFLREHGEAYVEAAAQEAEDTYSWMRKLIVPHQAGEDLRRRGAEYKSILAYQDAHRLEDLSENDRNLIMARRLHKALDQAAFQHDSAFMLSQDPQATLQDKSDLLTVLEERFWEGLKIPAAAQVYEVLPEKDAAFQETMQDRMNTLRDQAHHQTEATQGARGVIGDMNQLALRIGENIDKCEVQQTKFHADDYPWTLTQEVQKGLPTEIAEGFNAVWIQLDEVVQRHLSENLEIDQAELERFKNEPGGKAWSEFTKEFQKALLESIVTAQVEEFVSQRNRVFKLAGKLRSGRPVDTISGLMLLMKLAQRGVSIKALPLQIEDWTPKLLTGTAGVEVPLDQIFRDYSISPDVRKAAVEEAIAQTVMSMVREELTQSREERNILGTKVEMFVDEKGLLEIPSLSDQISEVVALKNVDVEKVLPLERIGELMAKLDAAWKLYHDARTVRGTLKFVEGEKEGTAPKITLTWARLPPAEQELIKRYLQGDAGTMLNWRNQKGPVQFAAAEIQNLVQFYVLTGDAGAETNGIKEAILSRYNLAGMDDAIFTAFVDRQLKSRDQFANNKLGILVFKLAMDETDKDIALKMAESGMKAGFAALDQDETLMTRDRLLASAYQRVRQSLTGYYAEEIKKARRSTLLKRASEKIGQAVAWDRQRDAVDPIAVQVALRCSKAKVSEQDVMRFLMTLGSGVYEAYHRGVSRNAAALVRGVQGQLEAAILGDQVLGAGTTPLAPLVSPFVEVRTEAGARPEEVFACTIGDFEIREDKITAGVTEDQFHRVHGLKAETIHFTDANAGTAFLQMHSHLGLTQEQIKNLVHEMKILQRQAEILGVKRIVLHRNDPHAAHIDEDGTAHYALEAFLSYPISEDVVGDHVRTHALIPNEVEDTRIPQNMRALAEEMAAIWHTLQRVKIKYSTKGVLHETFTKAFARGEGTLPGVDPEGKALALFQWYVSREDYLDEDIFAKILEHIEASPNLYGRLLAEDVARLKNLKVQDRAQYEMVLQGMISKSLGNVGKLPKYKRLARQVKDTDTEALWNNLLNFLGKLGDENFDVKDLGNVADKKPYEIWELIKDRWQTFFERDLKYSIEPHDYYLYYQKTALHLLGEMPLEGVGNHRSFIRYLIENDGLYKKILGKQDRSPSDQIKEIEQAIGIYNLIHKLDGKKVQYSPQQLELIRRAFFLRPEVVQTVIQTEKRLAKYRSIPTAYANDAALNEVMRSVIDIFGWLPKEVIERISKGLNVPIMPTRGRIASVYASILSYERFRVTEEPREVEVDICIGLPCALANQKAKTGERFVEAAREAAQDEKFDFKTAACFGKCNLAPVIAVIRPGQPRVLLGHVNLEKIHAIIKEVSGAADLPNLVNFFGYWKAHLKLADETAFADELLIADVQGLDAANTDRIKGYKLGIDYKGNMLVLGEMGTLEPIGTFVDRSVSFEYTDTDGQKKIGTFILDQDDRVKAKIQYQGDQAFEKEVGTGAAPRVSYKEGWVFLEGRSEPIGRIQSNTVAIARADGGYASITLNGENQAAPLQTNILDRGKEAASEDQAFLKNQDRVLLNAELRVAHPWDIEEYMSAGGYATVKDFLNPEHAARAYLEKLHSLAGEAGKSIELFQKHIAIIQGVRAWKLRQKKIDDVLRPLRPDQLQAILAGERQAMKALERPVKEMAVTDQELRRAAQRMLATAPPVMAPEYFIEDYKYGNAQTEAERDFFKALEGLNDADLKALADIHPSQKIINEVRDASLLGRGGAGFPAAMKMQVTKDAEIIRAEKGMNEPVQTKYWVVNLDEGDPGAFIDRSIAEERAHQLIEGAILGSLAIGAKDIYIYIRSEYDDAVKILERAIGEARRKGLLGKNIFGIPGLDLDVHITHGAGSFLAGEKRAILSSTMGGPAEPDLAVDRMDPRESLLKGLWGQPQDTQNAKTTAFIPMIMKIGGKAFNEMGYYVIELPRHGTVKTIADAAEEKTFLEKENTAKIVLREGGNFLLEFKDPREKERFLSAYAEAEVVGPNTYKLSAKAFRIMPFESKEQEQAFLREGKGLKIFLREGGTFAYSVSGAVQKTGRVEIRVGRTIRDIERIAGGPQPGKVIRGVQFGGPSGAFLNRNMNPDIWDAPLAFGTFRELAMIHGSGGVVFLDESADILPVVRDWTLWLQREACGQCGCEKGSKGIADWIDVILQGNGDSGTIAILKEQGSIETVSSKCGLGLTAANPALTTLRNFPVDYLHALLANGKIDKDELFRILHMLGLATESPQEGGRNKYILSGSMLKFILSEFDIIDKYRAADQKRKGRFLALLGLTAAQAAQPRGDIENVAEARHYDLSKVSRPDGTVQVSFFRTPTEQPLLISRAARRKANLSKALYKFTSGPEKGMKAIAYDSSAVHELAHKQNLYPREIIALGILHEARHAAIAQIKENLPNLLTQLKDRLEKKMTPQGLRAFLKAFLLTFPEPDLYDEIIKQGLDEGTLDAIDKQYLSGRSVQSSAIDSMLDAWLDRQGLEWAVEEVLVRSVEARNAVLRSHPLIANDFLDQESFKVVTEEIGEFFQDPGISAIVIRAGPLKDKPVSLSLLQFSNGQDFAEISVKDQLINARRQGFDLHGIDVATVKTAKYRGNPLATLRDGRLVVNPNSPHYDKFASPKAASEQISGATKALMSAARRESPMGKGVVTVEQRGWLGEILSSVGLENLPVVKDQNVHQDQALATVNWLALVATMGQQDPFLNDPKVTGWRESVKTKFAGRQTEAGKKINVKALTLKQIEQDFLDAGTRALIQKDIDEGMQYVILTEKYMPEHEVYARLGKSNFNPDWVKQGKFLLVEAIENNTLNVDDAVAAIQDAIKKVRNLETLSEDVFKAFVQDPENPTEDSNFTVAFHEGLKLTGRYTHIRHVNVREGVRLSETLTFLHGLFNAPLKVVIEEMRAYLLGQGFTADEIDEVVAMEGDVLVPPASLGDMVNQMQTDRGAAVLINWAA